MGIEFAADLFIGALGLGCAVAGVALVALLWGCVRG